MNTLQTIINIIFDDDVFMWMITGLFFAQCIRKAIMGDWASAGYALSAAQINIFVIIGMSK